MLSNGTIVRRGGKSGVIERVVPGSKDEYFVLQLDGTRVVAKENKLTVPDAGVMSTPELRRAMKDQLGVIIEDDGYEYSRVMEWTDDEMRTALTA